jgi:hypothetical protein
MQLGDGARLAQAARQCQQRLLHLQVDDTAGQGYQAHTESVKQAEMLEARRACQGLAPEDIAVHVARGLLHQPDAASTNPTQRLRQGWGGAADADAAMSFHPNCTAYSADDATWKLHIIPAALVPAPRPSAAAGAPAASCTWQRGPHLAPAPPAPGAPHPAAPMLGRAPPAPVDT